MQCAIEENDFLNEQAGKRAKAHTANLTLEILKNKKQLRLLDPHHWLANSPDLNLVDFGIWGAKFSKMYPKAERYLIWIPLKKPLLENGIKFCNKSLINVLKHSNLDIDV